MSKKDKLIKKVLKGDKKAFDKLFAYYAGEFLSICMRYARNKSDAEDILQEGFITIYTKINSFSNRGSFEGWMKRIVINSALNHNRQSLKSSFQQNIEELDYNNLKEDFMVTEPQQPYSHEQLITLIQKMPVGYKTIFNLYVFDNYTHKEIADQLNISENTSKSQLFKGRKYLKKELANLKSII